MTELPNIPAKADNVENVEDYKFEPIKGYPMLHWQGKRPFTGTQYYPAQLKEQHGSEVNGWLNQIFWGDNLQVMSHLLKKFRGKVDLIYIDPPFDSKADYKKKISLKGLQAANDHSSFEEKQYSDIWNNDEYLQFMYERLILLRELLSDTGSIYLHCDWHKVHYLRCILDEIFGSSNFRNEIIWQRKSSQSWAAEQFGVTNDTILFYCKSSNSTFNPSYSKDDNNTKNYIKERFIFDDGDGRKYMKSPLVNPLDRPNLKYEFHGIKPPSKGWLYKKERMEELYNKNELVMPEKTTARIYRKIFEDTYPGQMIQNVWVDIPIVNPMALERIDYPTQKPEALIERIIKASTNPGDLVFDCFMGSGTTQAVAMKLGRRFIGADINLGAVQTTTKRLLAVAAEIQAKPPELDFSTPEGQTAKVENFYTGFQVHDVNHYDVFRNTLEAKSLLLQALEIQELPGHGLYDGEKDGRMVKIMPINRIATRSDLNELITGFDQKTFEQRYQDNPGAAVEQLTLVCMGHEPDLAAQLQRQLSYKLDIEIVDILRDKSKLEFKREAEAELAITQNGEQRELHIKQFFPMNLLQKLSLQKENVESWQELTESVMIDYNYDGSVFEPKLLDLPGKNELVKGSYPIPGDAGTIRVKITDLLSESWEGEIHG